MAPRGAKTNTKRVPRRRQARESIAMQQPSVRPGFLESVKQKEASGLSAMPEASAKNLERVLSQPGSIRAIHAVGADSLQSWYSVEPDDTSASAQPALVHSLDVEAPVKARLLHVDADERPVLLTRANFPGRLADQDIETREAVWRAMRNKQFRLYKELEERVNNTDKSDPQYKRLFQKLDGDRRDLGNFQGDWKQKLADLENERRNEEYRNANKVRNQQMDQNQRELERYKNEMKALSDQKKRRMQREIDFQAEKARRDGLKEQHAAGRRDRARDRKTEADRLEKLAAAERASKSKADREAAAAAARALQMQEHERLAAERALQETLRQQAEAARAAAAAKKVADMQAKTRMNLAKFAMLPPARTGKRSRASSAGALLKASVSDQRGVQVKAKSAGALLPPGKLQVGRASTAEGSKQDSSCRRLLTRRRPGTHDHSMIWVDRCCKEDLRRPGRKICRDRRLAGTR